MAQVSTGEVEWRCFYCGSCNWSEHRMCTSCKKWRDQDWSCVMCGYKNFAKRDTCKECGAGHVPEYNQEAGTYQNYQVEMPGSGYQEPYSVALDSSYSKVPAAGHGPAVPESPEHCNEVPWLCGMCNTENTPKRILCFECSGHRERVEVRNRAAEGRRGQQGGPGLRQSPSLPPLRDFTPPRDIVRVQYHAGGTVEDQTLDWHCSNCDNRNFAKRSKCNKCLKLRSEVETRNAGTWGSAGSLDYVSPYPRGANHRSSEPRPQPFMPNLPGDRPEDKSNDWSCSKCENRNFAKRKECNRCKMSRSEVEDKKIIFSNEEPSPLKRGPEPLMLNHSKHQRSSMMNEGPRPEDVSNDWVCGKCNINCFAKKSSCFRCGKPRSEVETRNVDVRQFERPHVNYPSTPRSHPISLSGHNLTLRMDSFRSRPRPGPLEKPTRKWVDEDKSNDWNCKLCYINNFAKRKSCFQCKKNRRECESKEVATEAVSQSEATEVSVDEVQDLVVIKND